MNKEARKKMIQDQVEAQLKELGLTEAVRKIKFQEKPIEKMGKEEKALRFLKATMDNDIKTKAALSGGVTDGGLTLLPIEFHQDIIDRVLQDTYSLRSMCTVVPVTYRNGNWPVGATGVVTSWDGENNPITETEPTFGNLQYSVNRLDGYTAMSRDLIADTPVQLYGFVANLYAKAFVKEENRVIISGTGIGQPEGVRTNTSVASYSIKDTAGNILSSDDIVALPYKVDIMYRNQECAYFMNTSVVEQVRKMKNTMGDYIFKDGDMTRGQFPTLCGYKVYEFTGAIPSNLGTSTNQTEIIFGNLKQYYLFDKNESGVEMNTQSDQAFKNHQVLLKLWERLDGKIAVPKAFARLTSLKAVV